MRVAVATMLLVFLGWPVFALAKDGDRVPKPAPIPVSDSGAPAPAAATSAASATTSASPNSVVATAMPDAPPMSTEVRTFEPKSAGLSASEPSLDNAFLANNSLASIHALVVPPAAIIKLKTPARTHSFFDSHNRFGFATLGASLTADALSTQKGLAYPGFVEMNPIARPFVQTRMGAAAYNAGSFGLVTGLMYWAHKTEHHKLEHILPFAVGGWEGLLSARNYRVIANRSR